MQFNKTKFTKLESKKSLFLQTGFVVALAVVLFAFEWKTPYSQDDDFSDLGVSVDFIDEIIPITRTTPPEPPPKPKVVQINVVIDEKKVDDVKFDDVGIGQNEAVNISIPEPPEPEPEPENDEPGFILVPQIMPEFPGGMKAYYDYLSKNLVFPSDAIDAGVQGKVYVSFIVEEDGSITTVKINRGIGFGCDEEAVKVLENMPNWKPGIQMDRPVRVQMQANILFELKE